MAESHLEEDAAALSIPGVIEVEADSSGLQAFNRSRPATDLGAQSIRADHGIRYQEKQPRTSSKHMPEWRQQPVLIAVSKTEYIQRLCASCMPTAHYCTHIILAGICRPRLQR